MSYITLSNSLRIIRDIDSNQLPIQSLYKIPIYFLSKYEKHKLLAIRELLENPLRFFNEIYQPIISEDTYRMVYEDYNSSFHENAYCKRLNSDYNNYKIPYEIIERGKEEVIAFRSWFKTNKHHFESGDIDLFVINLKMRWNILTSPKSISIENSGRFKMENRTIKELEEEIDQLIKAAGRFYFKTIKHNKILKKFNRMTFLAYNDKEIYGNDTGYNDYEVKSLLKEYDKIYKQPLMDDLINYYRIKFNPNIELEGRLLENLGFTLCRTCGYS